MHQVRYFRALCEELNFTRAAERCNVSQPSLTRSIRLLEEEFGGRLFHRERTNTHLSELGRVVRPHLDQIYEQASIAGERARGFMSLNQVTLKLGIMCTIAPTELIQLVTGVRKRHPGVHLDIVDANAASLDEDLLRGELEVAIYCIPEKTRDPRLHYLPLFREQFMIVVSPSHQLAKLDAVRVIDLNNEAYLERVNCEFGEAAGKVFEELGVDGETVYKSDRDDWILAMAATGMGYSFMPQRCANHPGVVSRPLVEPEFWREVSLVTVRGRPHSPAVGALIHEAMRATWMNGQALAVRTLVDDRGRQTKTPPIPQTGL
ncbi:MAG: LysR family transcriptional regulator [Hyphomicrobiales bacterium]